MHVIGHAKLSEASTRRSRCFRKSPDRIAAMKLSGLSGNQRGSDYLCLVSGSGAVEVESADVETCRDASVFDPDTQFRQWAEAWLFRRTES